MEKVILITGATDGLGRGLALELGREGYKILLHGRNRKRAEAVAAAIVADGGAEPEIYIADFSSLAEVAAMADAIGAKHPSLDVLVNNAGLGVETRRRTSRDGYEMLFQVDFLAGYLLTRRLLPFLEAAAPARIVNVSSAGQAPVDFDDPMLERHWNGVQSYCQAKLAQIMMTVEMADELKAKGVTINALHPASYMPTKIVKGLFSVASTLEEGVESVRRLTVDPDVAEVTGQYFDRKRQATPNDQAANAVARARLIELADKLIADSLG